MLAISPQSSEHLPTHGAARPPASRLPAPPDMLCRHFLTLDAASPLLLPGGYVPAGDLAAGDCLITREGGDIALRAVIRMQLRALGRFAPIRIGAGVFGAIAATRLMPSQRLLFEGWRAEQMCGYRAATCAAGDLVNETSVQRRATGALMDLVCLVPDHGAIIPLNGLLPLCRGLDASGLPDALRTVLPAHDPHVRRTTPHIPHATRAEARAICAPPPPVPPNPRAA